MPQRLQPALHDLVMTVRAPAMAASPTSGQMTGDGLHGFYVSDRRVLSALVVEVDGRAPEPVGAHPAGAGVDCFDAVCRHVGDPIPDPTVLLHRRRELVGDRLVETLELASRARTPVAARLVVRATTDLAPMAAVKTGRPPAALTAAATPEGLAWSHDEHGRVELATSPAPSQVEAAAGTLAWDVELAPGATHVVVVTVTPRGHAAGPFAPAKGRPWGDLAITSPDPRLPRLVERSLHDLEGLLLLDGDDPFLAAGGPWFLTLFGRDSLWAADMLLPLGTDLAMGTLRTLARRQGTRIDRATAEAPGKILHEVRGDHLVLDGFELPPLYYGSVDATPLWIRLLGRTWQAGADDEAVEPLLPAMEAAMGWLYDHADRDGDGFIEYVDESGRGLANQGWKDSLDAIQFADGRLAEGPIALSEVQAYAVEAGRSAARLLDHFDRPGADRAREWADRLDELFRARFWVEDERGPYPALALDRDKRPVDGVGSNMGHLLGTGILSPAEAATVAGRLADPELASGHGLRTLALSSARFSPLSYHGGSVWPHDTTIAVAGLAREGFSAEATELALGLVAAAPRFDHRLPELFSGAPAVTGRPPLPYPAACRPQAWAAASVVALITAVLGLEVDVPAQHLTLADHVDDRLAHLSVGGLWPGHVDLSVKVGAGGEVVASHPWVSSTVSSTASVAA